MLAYFLPYKQSVYSRNFLPFIIHHHRFPHSTFLPLLNVATSLIVTATFYNSCTLVTNFKTSMYEDSVSSGSSGRREAIRALSRAPSNSTFTMSSRSSSGSKEYCLPEADLPECRRPLSRFARPQKPSIDSVTEILPAGIAMMRQRQASKTTSNTDHMNTQQSTFDIPPVPGFSELLNGTYDDGTAVFSNETKPSRFSSSRFQRSISQQFKSRTSCRSDVEAVNVPEEEQAIVLSLKVLRDKVNQLENAATERELYMMELEQKVKILESDNVSLQRRYRSDSALGLDDGDSDDSQGTPMAERTLTVQKNSKPASFVISFPPHFPSCSCHHSYAAISSSLSLLFLNTRPSLSLSLFHPTSILSRFHSSLFSFVLSWQHSLTSTRT